ncbi:hypothetical protein OAX78_03965 [Planctomycetota bacterium]|nr:hypothetical protein [Planctomycetota bacterium]
MLAPPSEAPAETPAPVEQPSPTPIPEWTPPETFWDKWHRWSHKAVRGGFAAAGVASIVLAVFWGVPAIAVANSAEYDVAKQDVLSTVAGSGSLSLLGQPLRCDAFPDFYRHEDGEWQFRFHVSGPRGRARVTSVVRDGAVVGRELSMVYE